MTEFKIAIPESFIGKLELIENICRQMNIKISDAFYYSEYRGIESTIEEYADRDNNGNILPESVESLMADQIGEMFDEYGETIKDQAQIGLEMIHRSIYK